MKYFYRFNSDPDYKSALIDYEEPWVSATLTAATDEIEEYRVDLNLDYPERAEIFSKHPMTFKIKSDGEIVWKATNACGQKTIQYCMNSGGTWNTITSTTGEGVKIEVHSGDIVQFKGTNSTYSNGSTYSTFSGTTCRFSVCGNIMSMTDGNDFEYADTLNDAYTFQNLFAHCQTLIHAKNLIFPATNLTNQCYRTLFEDCPLMVSAPTFPATTLKQFCYFGTFYNCPSLSDVQDFISASTCPMYSISNMYWGCSSLVKAPDLIVNTLESYSSHGMFENCTSLKYFKCLAINHTNDATNIWLKNVSPTGTFIKRAGASWISGDSGIPNGWNIVDQPMPE